MISILISVYNCNPGELVRDLSDQMANLSKPGEIITGNDHSDSTFMPFFRELEELPYVQVFNAPENLGRSKMRNRLAGMAAFPNLLFIDGDATIISNDFIENYLSHTGDDLVVCGGTAYCDRSELSRDEILRWVIGKKREVRTAFQRNNNPHRSFSSFNFMLPARVFRQIGFDEHISKYGHEDTIFGIELARNNIRIKHIDNQLIHSGLDTADIFLVKTREGLENLINLSDNYSNPELLIENIRILKKYKRFKKWGLRAGLKLLKAIAWKIILRNLKGRKPSVFLFDVYKLIVLSDIEP